MNQEIQIGKQGWTNNILYENEKDKIIYYIPCYLRIKIKNFISVELSSQQAQINVDILFTIYYGGLSQFLVEELSQNIILQFNRNDAIRLIKTIEISKTRNQKYKTLSFTIRKNIKCKIDCDFFWSPFQIIYLALVITIRSIFINHPQTNNPIIIRFNLMDHYKRNVKISYTKQDSFGNYKLSSKKLQVYYSRQLYYDPYQSNKEQEQLNTLISLEDNLGSSVQNLHEQPQIKNEKDKLGYYQYGHFVIPMYKYPYTSLFTIFFPMWSLSLYNLFMFYQGNDLSMRINNGVFLLLSLFAYIPTIRQQIPTTPNILFVQILIYSISITFHLTLIQSYIVSGYDLTYKMIWNQDIYFIASVIIIIISVVIVFVMVILHKFIWEKGYVDSRERIEDKFNRLEWKNEDCDQYFKKYSTIRILK